MLDTKLNTDFTYELMIPITYSNKEGVNSYVTTITVKAPIAVLAPYVSVLEQEYNKAIFTYDNNKNTKNVSNDTNNNTNNTTNDNANSNTIEKESKEEPKEIMLFIVGNGGELLKCINAFKNILLSSTTEGPVCMVNNETKMTGYLFDKLAYQDLMNLLGKYFLDFLLSSLKN